MERLRGQEADFPPDSISTALYIGSMNARVQSWAEAMGKLLGLR